MDHEKPRFRPKNEEEEYTAERDERVRLHSRLRRLLLVLSLGLSALISKKRALQETADGESNGAGGNLAGFRVESGTALDEDEQGHIHEIPSRKGSNITIQLIHPLSEQSMGSLMEELHRRVNIESGAEVSVDRKTISIRSLTHKQIRQATAIVDEWAV